MRVLILKSLIAMMLASGLNACVVLTREVLYHPDRQRVDPVDMLLPTVRETPFVAADGTQLIAWRGAPMSYETFAESLESRQAQESGAVLASPMDPVTAAEIVREAAAQANDAVVLYLHGNGSNLARRHNVFRRFTLNGFAFAALSYRSFSGSEGDPSEAANIADALAYYDALIADGVSPQRLVLYGESLGSGVAVQIAAQRPVAGVVLHAPYDAIEDIAASRFPFLFPKLLLTDAYRSIDYIGDISAPILWIHGDADRVVPLASGRRLFEVANEPKQSRILPGAGHLGLYGEVLFQETIAPFIRDAAGGALTAPEVSGEAPEARPQSQTSGEALE